MICNAFEMWLKYGLSQCDIVKISEEELEFITGTADINEGTKLLQKEYDITLMSVTLGKAGSIAFYKNHEVKVDGFPMENTVNTTGAGDTFCGCVLNYILESGMEALSEENLKEMLTFANGAALVTTKKGALCSMPAKDEILKFLQNKSQKDMLMVKYE